MHLCLNPGISCQRRSRLAPEGDSRPSGLYLKTVSAAGDLLAFEVHGLVLASTHFPQITLSNTPDRSRF